MMMMMIMFIVMMKTNAVYDNVRQKINLRVRLLEHSFTLITQNGQVNHYVMHIKGEKNNNEMYYQHCYKNFSVLNSFSVFLFWHKKIVSLVQIQKKKKQKKNAIDAPIIPCFFLLCFLKISMLF